MTHEISAILMRRIYARSNSACANVRAPSRVRISGLAPTILRANRSIYCARFALVVTRAARPYRNEFRLDLLLPAAERGPVLRRALRRLAAIWRSLAIFRRPPPAISSRHWRVRELRRRLRPRRLRITVALTRSDNHRASAMLYVDAFPVIPRGDRTFQDLRP